MKQSLLMIVAVSIMIFCFLSVGFVAALEQNEASITLAWSSQTIYQGSIVNVVITFHNKAADEIKIEQIGLHFDWMAEDYFAGRDFSTSPIAVPAGGSHTFDAITITVSNDTSVGAHSYFVGVDGSDSFGIFVWDSPEYSVEILSSGKKAFEDLLFLVQKKLSEALNVTYENPEAQSLLQQAKDAYSQANREAYEEGNYGGAISTLETLSSYLDQAEVAEKQYAEQMVLQQQLLLIAAIIAIVVVAIVIIALVWRKRRKMKPKVKRVALKEELTISGVTFSGGDTIDLVVDNSGTKDFAITEVWINKEKQAFNMTPLMTRVPPNESVHVSLAYTYSKGTSYNIKIVSDRKKVYLVSANAL